MLCPKCGASVGDQMKLCSLCEAETLTLADEERSASESALEVNRTQEDEIREREEVPNPLQELLRKVAQDTALLYVCLGAFFFLQILYYMLVFVGEELFLSFGLSLSGCGLALVVLHLFYGADAADAASHRVLSKRLVIAGVSFILLGSLL